MQDQRITPASNRIEVDHFHLDIERQCVRLGDHTHRLRPKSFAVLSYLVLHRERIVSKEELLDACWDKLSVNEEAIKRCVREIRQVLGDSARSPRFVETIHGVGYRFIGAPRPDTRPHDAVNHRPLFPARPPLALVGRKAELERLHACLSQAHSGNRQLVFISGEPGIGKSALLEAFVSQMGGHQPYWCVWGQCLEHHGLGEPYRPVLEALGQLGQRPDGTHLRDILRQYAPMWLAHLPALVSADDQHALHDLTLGITKARMLRELADALEVVTAECTLVLVLEDLHWSDGATLDLLNLLAQRRSPARLLILGTYRPVDMHLHNKSLQTLIQELILHEQCVELTLDRLDAQAVATYLTESFPAQDLPPMFAQWLYQHTEGHPLFMGGVAAYVEAQGWIGHHPQPGQTPLNVEHLGTIVPSSVDQLTELYLTRLTSEDIELLEIGSVAGPVFSPALVALVLECNADELERRCAALARSNLFLQECGFEVWPDETVATCYGFTHALYRQSVYMRLSSGRRVRLHRRLGECMEAVYGTGAREVAAVLALHFEQGLIHQKAVSYLELAAVNAMQRCAYEEAILHLQRGLALLPNLSDIPERTRYELTFNVMLGPAFIATRGWGAAEVEQTYDRAYRLSLQSTSNPHIFPAMHGLWTFHLVRAQLADAYEIGERLWSTASSFKQPAYLMMPHTLRGGTLFYQGQFSQASHHFEQGLQYYDPQQHGNDPLLYGQDFMATSLAFGGWTQWYLGKPDQARRQLDEVLDLARRLNHPFTLAFVLGTAVYLYQCLRLPAEAMTYAEALIEMSRQQGFPQQEAMGMMFRGWSQVLQGDGQAGVAQLEQGLEQYRGTGAKIQQSHWLALLAETYGQIGRQSDSLSAVTEAIAFCDHHDERFYEAELYRLRGEGWLRLPDPDVDRAQRDFRTACDIAERQGAKSLALRATASLCRLTPQPSEQARQQLVALYGSFPIDDELPDLQEAKAILAAAS